MTGDVRMDVNVTHNRESGEVRVILNLPLAVALDLSADLARGGVLSGTHALAGALRHTLEQANLGASRGHN